VLMDAVNDGLEMEMVLFSVKNGTRVLIIVDDGIDVIKVVVGFSMNIPPGNVLVETA
jgi:hypothetical protein